MRGARQPAVIELAAAEVQAETKPPPSLDVETVHVDKVDADNTHAGPVQTPPEPIVEPAPEAIAEPELIKIPPPQAQQRSMAGSMAIAALIGGLAGTAGGSLLPGFLGLGQSTGVGEIQKLQQQVTALANRPQASGSADIEGLRQKVQSLEGDIARRVSDAEKKLVDRLAGLETGLKDATARPGTAAASPPVDLSPLTQRLGTLEQGLKALDGKAEAGLKAAEPRIAAIAQQVDQATKRMNAAGAAPFFAATQGLAQTFQSGRPFVTELTAMELLGAEPGQIAALRPFAEKGAATIQQISTQFLSLASTIARSGEAEASTAMGYLQRFVKIRPAGEIGGSTPADLVATIEAALARSDIPAALAAWRKLPEQARILSKDWAAAAEARHNAGNSLSALQSAAIAALRNAKP